MSESSETTASNERRHPYYYLWLDATIHSKENISVQEELRSFIDRLQIFEELDLCEQYIQSASVQDQLILMVNGELGQELIPRIHHFQHVYSIYIYCLNKEFYQQWAQPYVKIKGIHSQFGQLIAQIQGDRGRGRRRRVQNSMDEPLSMSIYNANINSEQSTSDLDGRFVHSQLLVDCLLRMQSTPSDRNGFVSYCWNKYNGDPRELKVVEEFERTYSSDRAIEWYTRESFLYRLLNKSLRVQDIDLLFELRFLIRDIQQQLQQHQCSSAVRLYRGQLISKDELKILKQSKGKLISMNSFLSTSVDRNMGVVYLASPHQGNDNKLKPVLFDIYADPRQQGVKPFAYISSLSYFPEEKEVLMMLGSVFRLDNIFQDENRRWIIKMSLCGDNDHDLKSIVDHMKNQYGEQTRLLVFGHVLVDMARFDEAEKYYHRVLKELSDDDRDISHCYHALGKVACEKGNYQESLEFFQKSLKIAQQKLRKGHSQIGFIYTGLGEVYQKLGDTKQALESYKTALNIWTKAYHDQDEYIAWCFNNIGNVYDAQKNYVEALNYHKKALEIKERLLPEGHPCLGNTYINIGNVYYHLRQFDQALGYYELTKKIFEKSLPPQHPSFACILKNLGVIYEVQGELSKALAYYKKASFIREKCFSSTHPDVIDINQDINRVIDK